MISMISFDFINAQSPVYRSKPVSSALNRDEKLNSRIQKLTNFTQCGKMVSSRQGSAKLMSNKISVWLMALDRSRDIDLAIEDAEGTDFSFNDWRKKYMKFMKHKKSRVMDQMRKMDRNGTGYITNEDFIHHMVNSGFKSTEKEMRKVSRMSCESDCN